MVCIVCVWPEMLAKVFMASKHIATSVFWGKMPGTCIYLYVQLWSEATRDQPSEVSF